MTSFKHLLSQYVQSKRGNYLIPLLLGTCAYFLVIGPKALDPNNIAWLQAGDPAQHYLGWTFFRYSPWALPLGLNPNYGLDISSSIVYSDSIPLLAIFFKLFSPWLPETFQYFGLWYLLCFILQAYFAYQLLRLITPNKAISTLGVIYFIFSPIMLWRLGVHASLSAHFLILASLYLVLKPNLKGSAFWWGVLLIVTSSIHFYLLMMVLILFVASVADGVRNNTRHSHLLSRDNFYLLLKAALVITVMFSWMWLLGYFEVKSLTTMNYGIGRINILGLFDSHQWSYLPLDIPDVKDQFEPLAREYESFIFLGLGSIFCLAFAFPGLLKSTFFKKLKDQYLFLTLAFLFFIIFSISNHVGIGSYGFVIPLPDSLIALASILRASSRTFWPVYYLLMYFIMYFIIKSYSVKWIVIILLVGAFLQIADTSIGWRPIRKFMMQEKVSQMGTPLQNTFWDHAARRYHHIIVVLPQDGGGIDWKPIAEYAARYHLVTNSAYLGRYDDKKLLESKRHILEIIISGKYDKDTLYIVENKYLFDVLRGIDLNYTLFANIDGLNVLAPNWNTCLDCIRIDPKNYVTNLLPHYSLQKPFLFSRSGEKIFPYVLQGGWAYPEPWGTWSDGKSAMLAIAHIPSGAKSLTLSTRAFVTPAHPTQEIDLIINRQKRQEVILTRDNHNQITIPITPEDRQAGQLIIDFRFKNPAKPKDLGMGEDDRLLSIGLVSAVFK